MEQKINLDRLGQAEALFGSFDENVRLIEQEYGVTVTCRGTEIKVFGESHIDEIAAELKVPVLGKMPIDVKLAELADSGLFSKIENEYITAAADVMPKDEA